MKIIAATDFSATGANAVQCAARLARKLGDSLLLVHVVEPMLAGYPELRLPECNALDQALRASAQAQLTAAVTALKGEEVPVEGRLAFGPAPMVLADLAGEERARLVVLGSHGRGPAERFFVGSVAERTMLRAPCPVLVVPAGATPFADWKAGGRPLRVVVGLDLDAAGDVVMAGVQQLREAGECDVTLIHVYWPPAEYARLGLAGPRDLVQTDPEVVAVLEREIGARFGITRGAGSPRLLVHSAWGRPGDALTDDAQAEKADLLVVGTRQPHLWTRLKSGSSALAALRTTRTAILCVPARQRPDAAVGTLPTPLLRTVLCATDFSELGNAAIPYAYALVRGSGGTVELCHVYEKHPATPANLPYPLGAPMSPEHRAELEANLTALIPPDAARLGISTHLTVVDGGSAAAATVQAARRLGADAIVLASHGRSGVTAALLASVTAEVLRHAERPVFVVRPGS
jgi:nucleotide-binding universal stress UspA family protein